MTRLGVGIGWQRGDAWREQSLALLTPAIFYNWIHDQMDDERYLPMAYTTKAAYADRYIEAALAHPGKLWLLGNEPELYGTATTPDEVRIFAERWANEVGGEWAGFGCIVADKGLAWLDAYLALGSPLPTHWHIHLYYANTRVGWVYDWMRWVGWMRANDVVRPTIISETNLYGVSGDEAKEVLDKATDGTLPDAELLHSLVWYSDTDWHNVWHWSDLRNEDGTLTPLGAHFVELVTRVVGGGEPELIPEPEPLPEPEPEPEPDPPKHVTHLPWLWR